MADTALVTSNDDSLKPQDTPTDPAPAPAAPAPRKPLTNGWLFPVLGGLVGAYFLISGALGIRETQGNGVFALLVAGIVVLAGAFAAVMFRSYQKERAAKKL